MTRYIFVVFSFITILNAGDFKLAYPVKSRLLLKLNPISVNNDFNYADSSSQHSSRNRFYQSEQDSLKPPVSFSDLAGEFFIGTLWGCGSGIIGLISFGTIDYALHPDGSGGHLAGYGFVLFYVLGSAWGVYSTASDEELSGSFGYTLLGSAIGGIVGLFPAPLGASFAFHKTSEYRPKKSSETALINLNVSKIRFRYPVMQFSSNIYRDSFQLKICLVQIKM